MEFITRTLQSDPGMDQKEALLSLQSHPSFKPGTMIASVRRKKNVWVAELLEPKTAEFPPKADDGGEEEASEPKSESPAPKGDGGPPSDPDNDGDNDSSPSGDTDKDGAGAPGGDKPAPGGDKPGGEKPKGDTETAILHTLQQILHALQGGGAPEGLGGPDALGPGPGGIDGPPPPKGGPAGGPPPGGPAGGPPGKGGKPGLFGGPKAMKPGDTPPGGTPVGAPAFASTKQAGPSTPPGAVNPAQGTPVPQGPAGPTGGGTCPQCGGPEPCPIHGGLTQAVASYAGKAATINLSTEGTDVSKAVREAKPVLAQYGYTVKKAKRGDGRIHILASRR